MNSRGAIMASSMLQLLFIIGVTYIPGSDSTSSHAIAIARAEIHPYPMAGAGVNSLVTVQVHTHMGPQLNVDNYGYTHVPGIGAYKVHSRAQVWNTCRKICLDEGGYLAIINSVAEANAIASLARIAERQTGSAFPTYFHIGCHNRFKWDEWVTIYSDSLPSAGFNDWDVGQPNRGAAQACGCINYSTARLDDSSCLTPLGFVCEKDIPDNACDIPE